MNLFYILKGTDGRFYPMAFISPVGAAGVIRKEEYENKKLEDGEEIVIVNVEELNK